MLLPHSATILIAGSSHRDGYVHDFPVPTAWLSAGALNTKTEAECLFLQVPWDHFFFFWKH